MSVGDALAQARGQAGLSVAQVSQRTCIRETIIRGIERDDFSACGGDFYARGHIRSIARSVGLDPEGLVREYDTTHGSPHPITAADVFEPSTPIKLKERRAPNWTIVLVLLLALAVGYGIYRLVAPGSAGPVAAGTAAARHTRHHSTTSHAASPSPTPTHATHRVVISLTAMQDCWVQFARPDGTYVTQATVPAGSSQSWTFRHTVVMTIGNPGGILLTVDGKSLGRPGTPTSQPITLSFGPGRKLPSIASG